MPARQPAAARIPDGGTTALTNVRVFDGTGLQPPGTVVISNGLIGADAGGARVIDGRGGILLPGLIDAHIHLSGAETLEQLSAFGVTTALDMGTWPAELVDSLRGNEGLTDIRSSGVGATSPASRHGQRLDRPAEGFVAGPADAAGYVAGRVRDGADYIKIIIDLPGFDQSTVTALVSAAHQQGKLAITHASTRPAVAMAQRAGADVVTHAPLDEALDEEAAALMLAGLRINVPTLAMMEAICEKLGGPGGPGSGHGPTYAAARDSVSVLYRAGVPVLAGTDANTTPGVPASPPFGYCLHR
jgi:imidazolonepropionase-like amidohydrolase